MGELVAVSWICLDLGLPTGLVPLRGPAEAGIRQRQADAEWNSRPARVGSIMPARTT